MGVSFFFFLLYALAVPVFCCAGSMSAGGGGVLVYSFSLICPSLGIVIGVVGL
jgi:hypothetical protein